MEKLAIYAVIQKSIWYVKKKSQIDSGTDAGTSLGNPVCLHRALTSLGAGRGWCRMGSPGADTYRYIALGCNPSWAQDAHSCSSEGQFPFAQGPFQRPATQLLCREDPEIGRAEGPQQAPSLTSRAGPGHRWRDYCACFTEQGLTITELVGG